MTPPIPHDQLRQFLEGFGIWISDHAEDIAADLVDEACNEPTAVVVASPGDMRHSAIVLGVFTARAAMRKAIHFFAESPAWQADQKEAYLIITVTELQDAINNCNAALYSLGIPDKPGIAATSDQARTGEGGAT